MSEPASPTATTAPDGRSESARLDSFVDGAFAFAITLLIISNGNLPNSVAALERALRGIPAFAACFAELAWFWHGHVRWRDQVGRTDATSLLLSLLLVFLALIFVFPLHLVFAGMFNGISGGALSPGYGSPDEDTIGATRALFVFFGIAFACMAGALALLYRHGVRLARPADRTAAVTLRLRVALWTWYASVGTLSTLIALVVRSRIGWVQALPGLCYFLLGFTGLMAHAYTRHLRATVP